MLPEKTPIPILQGHGCFACGTNNPIGLKMEFYRQGNSVCSDVVLNQDHVGWENMVHGGIISTLLDEVMSWTVIYFKKSFSVTRRMQVRYLRPVPASVQLTVKGQITSDDKARSCQAEAILQDGEGNVLAKGEGDFAVLSGDKLGALPEDFRKQMTELFRKF
ncbi:MAG: PaaI family thioesterase [Deltaproteobacteria bacterium]|nr:MAG: PaaI family thioesterase [Deltaproteobacteria bacterium]